MEENYSAFMNAAAKFKTTYHIISKFPYFVVIFKLRFVGTKGIEEPKYV